MNEETIENCQCEACVRVRAAREQEHRVREMTKRIMAEAGPRIIKPKGVRFIRVSPGGRQYPWEE